MQQAHIRHTKKKKVWPINKGNKQSIKLFMRYLRFCLLDKDLKLAIKN